MAIQGLTYTVKVAYRCPDVIDARFKFATWLMSSPVVDAKKVFLDEFGFNVHTRRSQGRAMVGHRVCRVAGTQRGPNIAYSSPLVPSMA